MNIVVLLSGDGSNLAAMIQAGIKVSAVIGNNAKAYGIEQARQRNIPAHIVDHRCFSSRRAFDTALSRQIDVYQPDLIVLAGFMRKLGPDFIDRYPGKIINIHPSLLPLYPGLHTHQKVLQNQDAQHGVTVHFVNQDLDAGPVIAQASFTVQPNDTVTNLIAKAHELEHQLYPQVIKLLIERRITLKNDSVFLNGKCINDPMACFDHHLKHV